MNKKTSKRNEEKLKLYLEKIEKEKKQEEKKDKDKKK